MSDICNVIIVDDDARLRETIIDELEFNVSLTVSTEFSVRGVSGLPALQDLLAKDDVPVWDAVLLDYNFEKVGGAADLGLEELLPYIRQLKYGDSRFKNVVILFYTGQLGDRTVDDLRREATLAGADMFLEKDRLLAGGRLPQVLSDLVRREKMR